MYDRKGRIVVSGSVDEDKLFEAAIEAGCDDLDIEPLEEANLSIVYSNPSEMSSMIEALNSIGSEIVESNLAYVSKAPLECSEEDFEKNMSIIDALEDLDDVDSVE